LGVFSEGAVVPFSPEEAVVGLAIFGRYDQRLFDEGLSAAAALKDFISKSRLDNLMSWLDKDSRELSVLLYELILGKNHQDSNVSEQRPLFLSLDGLPAFNGAKSDPVFEKKGWKRNLFQFSTTVRPLAFVAVGNPWIRAKLTFGNSARADVIMALSGASSLSAPDMARQSGYSQKGLWNIFNDLEMAGWIQGKKTGKRIDYAPTAAGTKLLRPFRLPTKTFSVNPWIQLGYLLNTLRSLPDNASDDLIRSEEIRIQGLIRERGLE
jgi:hypothetical protein